MHNLNFEFFFSKVIDYTFIFILQSYVEDIFKAITSSALHCPSVMCQLFHDLKEIAICIFPGIYYHTRILEKNIKIKTYDRNVRVHLLC